MVYVTLYLAHESDWNVWQEVQDVDGGPSAPAEEVRWIRPLVRSRTLHHDTALWHAKSCLFVPALEDGDGLFGTLCDPTIVM